jgi:hypothetical protein
MKKYYVFETEHLVIEAEAHIRQASNMPVIGKNQKTGEPELTKTKTEKWATPKQRLDGKWIIPIINRVDFNVDVEFDTKFPNTIENYNSKWFTGDGRE